MPYHSAKPSRLKICRNLTTPEHSCRRRNCRCHSCRHRSCCCLSCCRRTLPPAGAGGLEHILRDQPWDFCQLQYNYLDTDDRAEEIAGDRGYALTEELNVPLIIMEPIKGGTLAQLPPDAAACWRRASSSAAA